MKIYVEITETIVSTVELDIDDIPYIQKLKGADKITAIHHTLNDIAHSAESFVTDRKSDLVEESNEIKVSEIKLID